MQHFFCFLFLVLFLALSCTSPVSEGQTTPKTVSQSPDVSWLVGKWKRSNDRAGRSTFESWQKGANGEYLGLGYTLQNGDTVFKEQMKLSRIEENWNLVVSGVNESPTYFVFTNHQAERFVCENETNEFPKKIDYRLEEGKLVANISGGGNEISFIFDRIAP